MPTRANRRTEVKTYKLVKADKPDLRQVRDSEGNTWFMEERCHSNGTRPGRRHFPTNDDKATALRTSKDTMSSQAKLQKRSTSTRCISPAGVKKGQGDQHLPIFEDTEFEARSCTTPRNAEWAEWAIHATSKTRQSGQQSSSKAEHSGFKNANLKRTKSRTVLKQRQSKRKVTIKSSGNSSHHDPNPFPDPALHSEDVTGDTNLRRGSTTSRVKNSSPHPEAVRSGSHGGIKRSSPALSTNTYSQSREVLIEDGSNEGSKGSTTPRAVNRCLPTVKLLNQHHLPGTSNNLKVDAVETTSKVPRQVGRPLARSNATRRSSGQRLLEPPLRHVTASPTKCPILEDKSPIPDIDDLMTIPSEKESFELLSRLPAVGKKFDWSSMNFKRQRSPPNVRVAVSDDALILRT
ncbi:hypothetical protein C0992_000418 [Termitomyces sp. T32_za158]|nr:hypothetical protein C0992_000418 [Termitomyces sp. T32_za158]